ADSSFDHKNMRISTRPDRIFIDVSGRALPDGSFALYLHTEKRAKKDANAALPDAFWASGVSGGLPLHASADEVVSALLVSLDEDEGVAFRRADDGRYERVHDSQHSVDFECSALPQSG